MSTTILFDKQVRTDLPGCPFCGKHPRVRPDYQSEKVNCKSIGCPIFEVAMSPELWVKRVEQKPREEVSFRLNHEISYGVLRPRPRFNPIGDLPFGLFREAEREWFEELLAHPHVQAIIKIPADEPIFVLRAQDKNSVQTIREWVGIGMNTGVGLSKLEEARLDAERTEEWQSANPDKVKTPD